MSLPLMIAAGVGIGAGVTCLIAALLPTRPDLRAALGDEPAALDGAPKRPSRPKRGDVLAILRIDPSRAEALVKMAHHDLELLGRTPAAHGIRKLTWAALAFAVPAVAAAALLLLGISVALPVAAGLVVASCAFGFVAPDIDAHRKAKEARSQLRYAINAYLVLVALERRAGAASQQALVQAARVTDTWTFRRLRSALDRAQLQRRPAWEGLRDLAAQFDVPELAACADIMATSADGAAMADTLLARARALRGENLSRQRGRASEASEHMVIPVAALGLCFAVLLLYPVTAGLSAG